MARRERSPGEEFVRVAKGLLAVFCMPIFFLLAMIFTISYNHSTYGDDRVDDWKWALLFWVLFLVPFIWRVMTVRRRRNELTSIVSLAKGEHFSPQKGNVIIDGAHTYFGVDAVRGTMLYVHMTRNGVYDVVGLDMSSWANVAYNGATLKLNLKMPELPVISINAPGGEKVAENLYSVICAMEHRKYEDLDFPGRVSALASKSPAGLTLHSFA